MAEENPKYPTQYQILGGPAEPHGLVDDEDERRIKTDSDRRRPVNLEVIANPQADLLDAALTAAQAEGMDEMSDAGVIAWYQENYPARQ